MKIYPRSVGIQAPPSLLPIIVILREGKTEAVLGLKLSQLFTDIPLILMQHSSRLPKGEGSIIHVYTQRILSLNTQGSFHEFCSEVLQAV